MAPRFAWLNQRTPDASERQSTPERHIATNQTLLRSILSTPHSKGTLGATEDEINGTTLGNIERTEEDLGNTQNVPFIAMMEAFLRRDYELKEDSKIDVQKLSEGERRTKKDRIRADSKAWGQAAFRVFLEEAVQFCNGESPSALNMKDCIREMVKQDSECLRYYPLVNGVNAVLVHFSGISIGGLAHAPGTDDLIYMIQDPAIIKSKPITADNGSRNTLRKPDAIGTSPFSHWVTEFVTHSQTNNEIKKNGQTKWGDCWNIWELKFVKQSTEVVFPRYTTACIRSDVAASRNSVPVDNTIPNSAGEVPLEQQSISFQSPGASGTCPGSSKGKRPTPVDATDGNRPCKKPKVRSRKPSAVRPGVPPRPKSTVTPEVQAAYYGIEMLRGRWDKTHSIVLLLKDSQLSLKWYDAEGCIETESIDIISHLPLMVVMLIIFQRFDHRMRGVACVETKASINGEDLEFDIPHTAFSPWQLRGTHTTATVPVRKGRGVARPANGPISHGHSPETDLPFQANLGTDAPLATLRDTFFKFSWREEARDPEGVVIATAKERARYYLPMQRQSPELVTDHLPDVKSYREYETLSTRHIRACLGLDTKESRVPTLMISRKYQPFSGVKPSDFRTAIWQVICCHYLLWQIGIAHGDISIANLLIAMSAEGFPRAIVNDFDQATIMEPMNKSPLQKGFQRAGTKAFMAEELSNNLDGSISRIYRHDLESIVWSMVCYVEEQEGWKYGSYPHVAYERRKWAAVSWTMEPPMSLHEGLRELWKPVALIAFNWVNAYAVRFQFPDKTDREWMGIIFKELETEKDYGTEWLEFQVPLERIRARDKGAIQ
ncbi:hypothetical protein BKA70DRAFT_1432418 [Coprinopsis sp. MPI-PUGE-AT-0042]|nr:hypothetical protein BKA70DRAFT_1432418 [Coprinopsis sp. MPI-PUGE-AT-0042]